MMLADTIETVPLSMDADGVIRVGGTRVTLDTVIAAFLDGATAEEITYQYPSLSLAAVYSTIAYYLRQRNEVEAYLQRRQEQAGTNRQQIESRLKLAGVRERLLARQSRREPAVLFVCLPTRISATISFVECCEEYPGIAIVGRQDVGLSGADETQ